MADRDLLLAALRGERTERPGWVPFVGCHGGHLIGKKASEHLRSPDLLVAGLERAAALYRPDGLPVMFDLQVEAEALGCELHWACEAPPSVMSHPLSGALSDDLPAFDLGSSRVPVALEACERARAALPDVVLHGLVTGPLTLAMHLLGHDVFFLIYDDPDRLERVLDYCAVVAATMARAYLDRGAEVIAVVDPMTSQIAPDHFERFVHPRADAVFDAVRDAGGLSSLFVCGDATRNLDAMCRCACDSVSIDENIPLELVRGLARGAGKSFGGNLKLTETLLLGNEDACRADALRCLDAGAPGGVFDGFVLAPGCDLPYATPEANLRAVAEIVHDPYARDVARRTIAPAETFDDVALPDYAREPSVIVEVITLDSGACAPCQYMFSAALEARRRLGDRARVDVREHSIKRREGLGAMRKLGVTSIPSICIDGRVAFSSIIPDTETLARAIVEAAERKAKDAGTRPEGG